MDQPGPSTPGNQTSKVLACRLLLGAILLLAAVLRLGWPDRSLPGLQIDEASNAWNAYCLLKTGHDEHGQAWPIFHTAAFDDYRSPLYLYLLMPFEAVWGMTPYTARLPAAVGGVVSVGLIYLVGKRLFTPGVGLLAAIFLAVSPWHLHDTRWGHEANISPLLVLAALAAMLAAGTPLVARESAEPRVRVVPNLLAGLLTGFVCYGYGSIRLYIPAFLLLLAISNWRTWRSKWAALWPFAVGFLGPVLILLCRHLTDPAMNVRAEQSWVWNPSDPFFVRVGKVLFQYAVHFMPGFLFVHGSRWPGMMPLNGFPSLMWFDLPLMLCGLAAVGLMFRGSASARVLLAGVLAYPAGDVFNGIYGQPHVLRSFAGIWALQLLAAFGAFALWRGMRRINRRAAIAVMAGGIVWAVVSTGNFLYKFFGSYNNDQSVYVLHNVGLQNVCNWLAPHLAEAQAVYWSQNEHPFIYAPMLVYLHYEPKDWFADPPLRVPGPDPRHPGRLIARFGKMHFMYVRDVARADLAELYAQPHHGPIYFVVHSWEVTDLLKRPTVHAVYATTDPSGEPDFFVLEDAAN
jgi:4-amino-4-deoxy-L-arabinose transferase-like glycosyltransferase